MRGGPEGQKPAGADTVVRGPTTRHNLAYRRCVSRVGPFRADIPFQESDRDVTCRVAPGPPQEPIRLQLSTLDRGQTRGVI